jgi:hypothetical protein
MRRESEKESKNVLISSDALFCVSDARTGMIASSVK